MTKGEKNEPAGPAAAINEQALAPQAPPTVRLIDRVEVCRKVGGLSYPLIWKLMTQGKFPLSRQIGDSLIGSRALWIESEIDAWISALPPKKLKKTSPEAA